MAKPIPFVEPETSARLPVSFKSIVSSSRGIAPPLNAKTHLHKPLVRQYTLESRNAACVRSSGLFGIPHFVPHVQK